MAYRPRPIPVQPPARVRLAPLSSAPRRVDGAWWPRSRDLPVELPPLFEALPVDWGEIDEVRVHGSMWVAAHPAARIVGHDVRLHRLSGPGDRHVLRLAGTACGWRLLLVVPPEISELDAERLMDAAAALRG